VSASASAPGKGQERWGFMMTKWHDQLRTAHLLKDDNAPACGARYYTSAGAQYVSEEQKCRNCRRMAARAARKAGG
jgi:hypothetical protein